MAEKTEQEISRTVEQVKEKAAPNSCWGSKEPSPAVPCSPDPLLNHARTIESSRQSRSRLGRTRRALDDFVGCLGYHPGMCQCSEAPRRDESDDSGRSVFAEVSRAGRAG